jgi:hypothetical protein
MYTDFEIDNESGLLLNSEKFMCKFVVLHR